MSWLSVGRVKVVKEESGMGGITIRIGYVGPTDCTLIIEGEGQEKELLIESPAWIIARKALGQIRNLLTDPQVTE